MDASTTERFWSLVDRSGEHWIWKGSVLKSGSCHFSLTTTKPMKRRSAQAISWEIANDRPLPAGTYALVTCEERRCVKPDHLETGGQADLKRWTPEVRAAAFWRRVDRSAEDGCWEWQGARKSQGLPYGISHLGNRPRSAHVVAWVLTNGEVPEGMFVCHRCDNPPCCRPDHLFLGAPADNSRDMATKGRASRQPKLDQRKLTDDEVREIRRRYVHRKVPQHQLAAEYGVTTMVINWVVNRRTYAEVPD